MNYRELKISEYGFLREMLYEALYVPEGHLPFPETILDEPEISKYIEKWGEMPGDVAIVAELNGELTGVVWGRNFRSPRAGYGYIDDDTPEISMAVKENFRNRGIGTRLIEEISQFYCNENVPAISLSVDKANQARKLYERSGFEFFRDIGTAITMKKSL